MSERIGIKTRDGMKIKLLSEFGPYCYLCLAAGELEEYAFIDINLPPNLPGSCDLDHIEPKSLGGKFVWGNIALSHHRCNVQKADWPLEVYLQKRLAKKQFSRKW